MIKYIYGTLLGLLFLLMSCQAPTESQVNSQKKLQIVATTGMIADALEHIVDTMAQVTAMMGPGVDPHLYKASRSDLSALREADIIFFNGLHLEGKMAEILSKLANQKPVIAVGDSLPVTRLITVDTVASSHDPHIWFDVSLWREAIQKMIEPLIGMKPEIQNELDKNLSSYLAELDQLHKAVKDSLADIPEGQRVLITAHDAFGYFGRAYSVDVKGLQGISTVSEFGLRDVKDLVDFIVARKIKAVFVESSIPERSLQAVVEGCLEQGHEVSIGGTLYSDAMGERGTPEGTYVGMVKANVSTIVSALK